MQSKAFRGKQILFVILSFLIGVGIWIYVDNYKGYTVSSRTYELPIEFIGEDTTLADRGLMLLDDSDQTVSLKFEGTRKLISELDPDKIRIQVNLSDVTATGTQSLKYTINYPGSKFTRGISVVSASSYSVSVNIGELYSKSVDIRCDIQGKVAEGYIAGQPQFLPEMLELRGQEEEVSRVSYAKITLNIDNAVETVTRTLNYELYDAENQLIEDTTNIHATSDQIQVILPVNVVKELPLKMNFIEGDGASLDNVDYKISPETITISGDAALLKDVDSIVLDDFDLSALSNSNVTTYNYAITVPDGCENLSGVTRATLTISFKDMATTTLTATRFQCENAPDGKTVTVLTDELPVALRGTSADIEALTPESLTVIADLKDVSSASGSYTVPATIQVDSDGNVGVVGTYQVQITIEDSEG